MINQRPQSEFEAFDFDEARMNLHYHTGDYEANRAIVFIHGLNGCGYSTWKKLPHYLFNDTRYAPIDIAIFDYFSGFRRRVFERPTVETVATVLNERLREVSSEYDEIYVVAHSMGGLITKDAVRRYLESPGAESGLLSRLSGAILIASPMNGSSWAHYALQSLVTEVKQLRPKSNYQQRIREFFQSGVDTDDNVHVARDRRYKLPLYSFWGHRDCIVDFESATLDIHPEQIRSIDKNHLTIVKPSASDSPIVTEIRKLIDEMSEIRSDIRALSRTEHQDAGSNLITPAPPSIVMAEVFLEADANDEWRPRYLSVIGKASFPRISVYDRSTSSLRCSSNLLISVHRQEDVVNQRQMTRQKIQELKARYDQGFAHARAVSVGPRNRRKAAMTAFMDMAGVTHQENSEYRLSFGAAEDDDELETRFKDYIAEIASKQRDALQARDDLDAVDHPIEITSDRREDL